MRNKRTRKTLSGLLALMLAFGEMTPAGFASEEVFEENTIMEEEDFAVEEILAEEDQLPPELGDEENAADTADDADALYAEDESDYLIGPEDEEFLTYDPDTEMVWEGFEEESESVYEEMISSEEAVEEGTLALADEGDCPDKP